MRFPIPFRRNHLHGHLAGLLGVILPRVLQLDVPPDAGDEHERNDQHGDERSPHCDAALRLSGVGLEWMRGVALFLSKFSGHRVAWVDHFLEWRARLRRLPLRVRIFHPHRIQIPFFRKMLYMTGTKKRVVTVAKRSPPITARPSGALFAAIAEAERHGKHANDHGQGGHEDRAHAGVSGGQRRFTSVLLLLATRHWQR